MRKGSAEVPAAGVMHPLAEAEGATTRAAAAIPSTITATDPDRAGERRFEATLRHIKQIRRSGASIGDLATYRASRLGLFLLVHNGGADPSAAYRTARTTTAFDLTRSPPTITVAKIRTRFGVRALHLNVSSLRTTGRLGWFV